MRLRDMRHSRERMSYSSDLLSREKVSIPILINLIMYFFFLLALVDLNVSTNTRLNAKNILFV